MFAIFTTYSIWQWATTIYTLCNLTASLSILTKESATWWAIYNSFANLLRYIYNMLLTSWRQKEWRYTFDFFLNWNYIGFSKAVTTLRVTGETFRTTMQPIWTTSCTFVWTTWKRTIAWDATTCTIWANMFPIWAQNIFCVIKWHHIKELFLNICCF